MLHSVRHHKAAIVVLLSGLIAKVQLHWVRVTSISVQLLSVWEPRSASWQCLPSVRTRSAYRFVRTIGPEIVIPCAVIDYHIGGSNQWRLWRHRGPGVNELSCCCRFCQLEQTRVYRTYMMRRRYQLDTDALWGGNFVYGGVWMHCHIISVMISMLDSFVQVCVCVCVSRHSSECRAFSAHVGYWLHGNLSSWLMALWPNGHKVFQLPSASPGEQFHLASKNRPPLFFVGGAKGKLLWLPNLLDLREAFSGSHHPLTRFRNWFTSVKQFSCEGVKPHFLTVSISRLRSANL